MVSTETGLVTRQDVMVPVTRQRVAPIQSRTRQWSIPASFVGCLMTSDAVQMAFLDGFRLAV